MLPYQGDKGSNLLKSLKRYVSKLLPENTKLEITFISKKLNSCFLIKDKICTSTQPNIPCKLYRPSCHDNYVGETGR